MASEQQDIVIVAEYQARYVTLKTFAPSNLSSKREQTP